MRDPSVLFDINGSNLEKPTIKLGVTLISGFNLPKIEGNSCIVSPYVEVSIEGIPKDIDSQTSSTINNNGFNPIWEEKLIFNLRLAEMCIIVFKIYSKNHLGASMIAQNAVPLYAVRSGIRSLQLLDSKLHLLPNSLLLCRVDIEPFE